ncbi:DNA polymerase III epsilon subunit [Gemmobacter caeni]|uniref:DNA-directed DNA polymerase n=1 Tax=Gemmobacter caeni TaxID=589035 RepID=A0A2T6B8H3_9RHOB|nr:exonuclease domain-containing protein [Gemmobacter caeni]PTX52318.1 DNA polymerase III epsilon subunit [Gemmobacter caeni]TWJ02690.1 DNA polymerase III epsilon subunit [Gemmobacter caeni]
MRLIAIDTETTGASPARGDRCVEIGAVELIDGRLTGRTFQTYLNPDHPVAWQAQRVHGLTNRFLADKPRFAEIAPDLLDFIGDATCLAHNARFDRDMLLYDFRHAGLPVPTLRFFDTIPFAQARVRTPSYRLDQLALTLGVLKKGRGLHGALEDAEILGRVVEAIETRQPGALAAWMRGSAPLSPLPKGWQAPPAPPTRLAAARPEPSERAAPPGPTAPQAASEEAREADRIAALVRAALDGAPDLALFAERLTSAGVLMRPVINGELALHGVRFSTPRASFTGGAIGLTGPALERAGPAYRHPEHAGLVARLVAAHDAVMGPVTALKGRFTATPASPIPPQTDEARRRVHALITEAIPGATTVFDLAARLEKVGIRAETRIDTKRMRVSSVLFISEGARVPGSAVGLGPKDRTPDFWSLATPEPVRMAPDGSLIAPIELCPKPVTPTRIGEGLNPGVAELIADLNRGACEIGPETVLRIRSGRDAWSGFPEAALRELLAGAHPLEELDALFTPLTGQDRGSALRWVCRGLDPQLTLAFHQTRQLVYEARNAERAQDATPEP